MHKLVVAGLGLACLLTLSAGSCEQKQNVMVKMQRVPKQYRDCFEQVTGPLPQQVPLKVLIEYTAKYRADMLRLQGCGRQTVAWIDHQMDVYARLAGK